MYYLLLKFSFTTLHLAIFSGMEYMHLELELPFLQVDDTLDLFNQLQLQHQAVSTKTKTLHDACDRLVGTSFCLLLDLHQFIHLPRFRVHYVNNPVSYTIIKI